MSISEKVFRVASASELKRSRASCSDPGTLLVDSREYPALMTGIRGLGLGTSLWGCMPRRPGEVVNETDEMRRKETAAAHEDGNAQITSDIGADGGVSPGSVAAPDDRLVDQGSVPFSEPGNVHVGKWEAAPLRGDPHEGQDVIGH